jgi:hypothetical protein
MQKLAVIIGGAILLVGVAAAGTFASLASGGDKPTISAKPAPRAMIRLGEIRREDRSAGRRANRRAHERAEARGRENEPGEDVRGREAEPNDDRGADNGTEIEDHSGPGSSNSGSGSDHSGGGHDGGGDDD